MRRGLKSGVEFAADLWCGLPELFGELAELRRRKRYRREIDGFTTFWCSGMTALGEGASEALRLAGEPVDTFRLAYFLDSLPVNIHQANYDEWRSSAYCNVVLRIARDRNPGNSRCGELERLFLRDFPAYHERVQRLLTASFHAVFDVMETGRVQTTIRDIEQRQ
jgi:hypothetical protein